MSTVLEDATKPGPPAGQRVSARRCGRILAALATLLSVGGAVVAVSGEARHQLALSFTRQPSRYAELYFSGGPPALVGQPRPAPADAGPGNDSTAMKVSFTVANHHDATTTFPYEVEVVDAAGTTLGRAHGSVTVKDGTAQMTTATVGLSAAEQWSAVEVRLDGRDERIQMLREGLRADVR
ncbi:MAG: hypothetical protein WAM92_05180 [Mycobacterium sp.]